MKKFEYLTIKHQIHQDELNELGEQGWELISYYMREYDIYIFKRPLNAVYYYEMDND